MRQGRSTRARGTLYGEAPFGWRVSGDRMQLEPDAREQRLIAVVRHMYLAERVPMREIVSRLQEMGIMNRRGQPFGLSRVWEMVHRGHEPPPEARSKPRARRNP